jgi:hypothetical protein
LQANIEGGEFFEWFYASESARNAQLRTPIADGAHGKPWVFRTKDLRSWWLNSHYNRMGGVEAAAPTPWVPQSKPIWFCELGVPSVDKGANQPNVFYDPKSSESFLPYYSRGTRDDLIQREALKAVLSYWATSGSRNPVSTIYGGRMIEAIGVWTWDARPYPAWPGRADLWSDGDLYPLGHWLNGKTGLADLAALVAERCRRVGLTAYDVSALFGVVTGYLRDRPMSPRAEIEALAAAFAFDAVESDGVIRFVPRGRAAALSLMPSDLAVPDGGEDLTLRAIPNARPISAWRWSWIRAKPRRLPIACWRKRGSNARPRASRCRPRASRLIPAMSSISSSMGGRARSGCSGSPIAGCGPWKRCAPRPRSIARR